MGQGSNTTRPLTNDTSTPAWVKHTHIRYRCDHEGYAVHLEVASDEASDSSIEYGHEGTGTGIDSDADAGGGCTDSEGHTHRNDSIGKNSDGYTAEQY